jgi:hypothetical protein
MRVVWLSSGVCPSCNHRPDEVLAPEEAERLAQVPAERAARATHRRPEEGRGLGTGESTAVLGCSFLVLGLGVLAATAWLGWMAFLFLLGQMGSLLG